ncbi:MAG: hypothetical protein FDZ69_11275 [Deltaproteobacteria bacterium]|nr:MAG: hypothetical protein FDZ69_11275 [Deltaproteobacteria bacterium]
MAARIFVIILLFFGVLPATAGAARLTLGVVAGAGRDPAVESQARNLATELTAALGDDVTVRPFDDVQTLQQWLGPFAMIDLGLVDAAFLAANPGKFLVLGADGTLSVVARQGAVGDFPQRVTAALSRRGAVPVVATARPAAAPSPAPAAVAPAPAPPVVAKPGPPPAAASPPPLVLGLTVTPDGLVRSPEQARQFAAQLGRWLGAPVRVRLLESEQALADWFSRFRMIDLAIIDEPSRRDPLTGNYRPLQRLTGPDGGSGLLVAQRDLPEARLEGALQALAAYGRDPQLGEIAPPPASPAAPPPAVAAAPAPAPPMPVVPVPEPVAETSPSIAKPVPSPPPVWPAAPKLPAVAASPMPSIPSAPGKAQAPVEPPVTVTVVAPPAPVAAEPTPAPVPAPAVAAPVSSAPPATVAPENGKPAIVPAPAAPAVAEVPAVIAQPDLPQELRPPGVPLPRPGKLPTALPPAEESSLLGKIQDLFGRTPTPPPLLPPPDPEPGVVYVVPFITLMVPADVRERIFDQFVDSLNQRGGERKLKFIILKQPFNKIDRAWLDQRKYVLGEIYGYVEDSGCCSTDLRARARLTFYRANLPDPALRYEYPVRMFFDHDQSTLGIERQKLSDRIANVLVEELLKVL